MQSTFDEILFNIVLERDAEWIRIMAIAPTFDPGDISSVFSFVSGRLGKRLRKAGLRECHL